MRIIRPLEKLKTNGLDQLFVHAAWPWTWTNGGQNTVWEKGSVVEADVLEIEKGLERRVMGEEYDSALLGKNKLPKSQWLKDHDMYEEFACWCANCHLY